jgi:hypothetical protein
MEMATMWTLSLKDFESVLEHGDPYPYYAVLLYPPLNGLNRKLHEYVQGHWGYMNTLTGDSCLLMALETGGQPIDDFRPEDVYSIARYLGAQVDQVPCLIFISEPKTRRQTLVPPLQPLFPDADSVTDDHLTKFFQRMQAIIDTCAENMATTQSTSVEDRLGCLRSRFGRQFVLPARGRSAVAFIVTVSATIDQVLRPITALLKLGH